jgi:hypothetical protein
VELVVVLRPRVLNGHLECLFQALEPFGPARLKNRVDVSVTGALPVREYEDSLPYNGDSRLRAGANRLERHDHRGISLVRPQNVRDGKGLFVGEVRVSFVCRYVRVVGGDSTEASVYWGYVDRSHVLTAA